MREIEAARQLAWCSTCLLCLLATPLSAQSLPAEATRLAFDADVPASEHVDLPIAFSFNHDGELAMYNVGNEDIFAVCGTYQYISPATQKLRTVAFDRSFVSPLLQPFNVLEKDGGAYVIRSYEHPSGLGLIHPMNPVITGMITASGAVFGPAGPDLKEKFLVVIGEARLQLKEIQTILKQCSEEGVNELLRSNKPIIALGRNSELIHLTLQNALFEDGSMRSLKQDYEAVLVELIRRIDDFRENP